MKAHRNASKEGLSENVWYAMIALWIMLFTSFSPMIGKHILQKSAPQEQTGITAASAEITVLACNRR